MLRRYPSGKNVVLLVNYVRLFVQLKQLQLKPRLVVMVAEGQQDMILT